MGGGEGEGGGEIRPMTSHQLFWFSGHSLGSPDSLLLLFLLSLLLLIIAFVLGSKNPQRIWALLCWILHVSITLLARGLLCSSLWALQAVLCAERNTFPAQHQRNGSLRTSPLHCSTPLTTPLLLKESWPQTFLRHGHNEMKNDLLP